MDFHNEQKWNDPSNRSNGATIFLVVCMVIGIILGIYLNEMRLLGATAIGLVFVVVTYFMGKKNNHSD